eukprot:snap_masked-scaffold_1-processed-gene-8.24-mRNA-1 protein AED:0.01 eAED:0.01 QI:0/-1/0/1/-1/1/1/0/268
MLPSSLFKLFGISFGLNATAYVPAYLLSTEKFYDLTGSITFLTLAYKSFPFDTYTARNLINTSLLCTWTLRLGSFLVQRIIADGEDKRFKTMKLQPLRFFTAFTLQSLWVFLTALPIWIINIKRQESTDKVALGKLDALGYAIWILGFALQVTADRQKRIFRAGVEAGKEKLPFITKGVWSWCQHPNYFGEISMWFGLYLSCSSELEGLENLAIVSPLTVFLLLRYVSGVPLLRAAAMKKYGKNKLFLKYINETNLLIPNPFGKKMKV